MKSILAALLLLLASPQVHAQTKMLSIDGDSMFRYGLDPNKTLPADLRRLFGKQWTVRDHSASGATITGANSVTSREAEVNNDFSASNKRNELLVWIGVNDGCNEGDDVPTAATEAQTYLTTMLQARWKITWLARTPLNAPWCLQSAASFRDGYNFAMFTWAQANGVRYVDPVQDNPALANPDDTNYYADGLHLTALSANIIAKELVRVIGK